jgi:hypothetical protein
MGDPFYSILDALPISLSILFAKNSTEGYLGFLGLIQI